jgi:hypothetical protein
MSIADVQWLASTDGVRLLDETAVLLRAGESEIQVIQKLRRLNIPPIRSGLLVKQVHLRSIGLRKFALAESMLFDERLLQQSTDERLARYKARRFQAARNIVDICCGLGGDTIGLGSVANVFAVDSSDVACFLTRHNFVANCNGEFSVNVQQCDANSVSVESGAWFHIDPDRRSSNNRMTRVQDFSPGIELLERLVNQQQHGAIKIAPASDLPEQWQGKCERQWIGDRHECKQQLLWFGDCANPNTRKSASAIDDKGHVIFEWCESEGSESRFAKRPIVAPAIQRFLYEPHATILAGDITDSLARQTALSRVDHDVEYLTGDEHIVHGALSAFEVVEVVRLDRRVIRSALEANDCRTLEVKKRGVDHTLMKPYQQMKFRGRTPLVLFLTRCFGKHLAIIGKRIS